MFDKKTVQDEKTGAYYFLMGESTYKGETVVILQHMNYESKYKLISQEDLEKACQAAA